MMERDRTAPHDKLTGLPTGAKVKMTVEAQFAGLAVTGEAKWMIDGAMELLRLTDLGTAHPVFQIERIEPPLSVDDLVRLKRVGKGGLHLAVRAIVGGRAWVNDAAMGAEIFEAILPLSDLERIP